MPLTTFSQKMVWICDLHEPFLRISCTKVLVHQTSKRCCRVSGNPSRAHFWPVVFRVALSCHSAISLFPMVSKRSSDHPTKRHQISCGRVKPRRIISLLNICSHLSV